MAEPFTQCEGIVLPLDRVNVDTDQIVPKQFCKFVKRDGYERVLFYDWRYLAGEVPNPEFCLNYPEYNGASILLTRANFGCGSSREHAVWALQNYGIRTIVAPSYGDIFYNNCFKNGILAAQVPDAVIEVLLFEATHCPPQRFRVDLANQKISSASGAEYSFAIDAYRKSYLLGGLSDIEVTLAHESRIAAYEQRSQVSATRYASLDLPHGWPN